MFNSHQFHAPIMSPFFCLHELYDDVTLNDVRLSFHPLMYPTDRESDSVTSLTLPYFMESNPSEPSYPSVICSTSNSSSSYY